MVSVTELFWVLSSAYGLERAQLVAALEGLLRTKEIVVKQAKTVRRSGRRFGYSIAEMQILLAV